MQRGAGSSCAGGEGAAPQATAGTGDSPAGLGHSMVLSPPELWGDSPQGQQLPLCGQQEKDKTSIRAWSHRTTETFGLEKLSKPTKPPHSQCHNLLRATSTGL